MSARLESLLDAERRDQCARNDAALIASMFPMDKPRHAKRHTFRVTIGPREDPRVDFCMDAVSSAEAVELSMSLAHEGERIEAKPAGETPAKVPPFSVIAARQQLACAEVREAIPEAARIAADLARNVNKGQVLAARADRFALEAQVHHLRCVGGL